MTSKESLSSPREIIIVGAGMAGIACAHEILAKYKDNDDQTIKVTMLEASDDIGGRVKGDCEFVPGHIFLWWKKLAAMGVRPNPVNKRIWKSHFRQWKIDFCSE